MSIVLKEPLIPSDARTLIRRVVAIGTVTFSKHALDEMENDHLMVADVTNVLRGGTVDPAEFENGSWRYRVRTGKICVVVAFRSETQIRIVTVWRK